MGFGDGGGRVSKSVFGEESNGVLFPQPHSHVFGVKTTVPAAWCLFHLLTHPDFRRKSCDQGLGAGKNQALGATLLAMTYQDPVLNKGVGNQTAELAPLPGKPQTVQHHLLVEHSLRAIVGPFQRINQCFLFGSDLSCLHVLPASGSLQLANQGACRVLSKLSP